MSNTTDPEILEFHELRAIANGEVPRPEGETSDQRIAREARLQDLYVLLRERGVLPRMYTRLPDPFAGRTRAFPGRPGKRTTGWN